MTDILVNVGQIASRQGVHINTIWGWAKSDPTFPPKYKLSYRCTRWKLKDVISWEKSKMAGGGHEA